MSVANWAGQVPTWCSSVTVTQLVPSSIPSFTLRTVTRKHTHIHSCTLQVYVQVHITESVIFIFLLLCVSVCLSFRILVKMKTSCLHRAMKVSWQGSTMLCVSLTGPWLRLDHSNEEVSFKLFIRNHYQSELELVCNIGYC